MTSRDRRRRLPVRRGALPRERRGEPPDAVSLQLLPPRGGGAGRRLGDVPARGVRLHEGCARAAPLVAARRAHVLPELRHAAHVSALGLPNRNRRHHREPRRSLRVPARRSHLDERADRLARARGSAAPPRAITARIAACPSRRRGAAGEHLDLESPVLNPRSISTQPVMTRPRGRAAPACAYALCAGLCVGLCATF